MGQGSTHRGLGPWLPWDPTFCASPPSLGRFLAPAPLSKPWVLPSLPFRPPPQGSDCVMTEYQAHLRPTLPSGPGGDFMQVREGLGLGEHHHLWHLQHGSAISALGWQGHSVCLVGTWQRWVHLLSCRHQGCPGSYLSWEQPSCCGWWSCAVEGNWFLCVQQGCSTSGELEMESRWAVQERSPHWVSVRICAHPASVPMSKGRQHDTANKNTVTGQEGATTAKRKEFFLIF